MRRHHIISRLHIPILSIIVLFVLGLSINTAAFADKATDLSAAANEDTLLIVGDNFHPHHPTNTPRQTNPPRQTATPVPTDTPVPTATNTAKPTDISIITSTPTDTATNTSPPPTATFTATDTPTKTPTPTNTATATNTATFTATSTATATDTPTLEPSVTSTGILPTSTTTNTPTATATFTPMPFAPYLELTGALRHAETGSSKQSTEQLQADPTAYGVGDIVLWDATLVNTGEISGTNVEVIIQIPDGLHIDAVELSDGTYALNASNDVTWYLPEVAAGETYRARVRTTIEEVPASNYFTSDAYVVGFPGIDATATVILGEIQSLSGMFQPFSVLDPNGPIPQVSGAPTVDVFAGTPVCWLESFTNGGTNPGFGPYILVILDPGLTLNSSTFIGSGITPFHTATFGGGGTLPDPITGETVSAPPGSIMYALRYPVGSVVTGGPNLDMRLCVDVNPLADIGTPLPVIVHAGYEFGDTATGVNGALLNESPDQGSITPILVTFEKTNSTPEDERPPGPDWTYQYFLSIELAPGQTLTNVTFADAVDSQWQYTGPVTASGTCVAAGQSITAPSTSSPGGTLSVAYASITNPSAASTCTYEVEFSGYITDILSETGGLDIEEIRNDATFNYSWGGVSQPELDDFNVISAENMVFQKSVSPTVVDPGDIVTYNIESQITEYDGVVSIVLTDTMPDGIEFVTGSASVDSGTLSTPVVTSNLDGTQTIVFAVTGPFSNSSTVNLTYQGRILQQYRVLDGGGDVRANDALDNTVIGDFITVGGASFQNSSSAGVIVDRVTLVKDTVSTPANGIGFTHGEPVTFRLTLDVPSGDAQSVMIEDFFPLPVFDVDSPIYGFGNLSAAPYTYPISAGATGCPTCGIVLGGGDNLGLVPTLINVDAAQNSLEISFPDVSTTTGNAVLEIEITIAVVHEPFADRLYLSNIAQAQYANTPNNPLTAESIDYLNISAPNMRLVKGISATTNPSSTFDPVAITNPVDNNLQDADGNDLITYVITAENIGSAPAYNVRFTDTLALSPARLTACTISSVTDGTLAALPYTESGGTFPFVGQLQLTNFLPGRPPTANPAEIAASTVLITYQCTIDPDVAIPDEDIVNTALVQFDSLPTGVTYPTLPQHSDDATTNIRAIDVDKSSVPTSGTIGDIIEYEVVVSFPGGLTQNVTLTDVLPAGFQFIGVTSVTPEVGLSSSAAGGFTTANAPVEAPTGTVTWTFGDVTSTSTSGDDVKTVTIVYEAQILNHASNNRGDNRTNTVTLRYNGGEEEDTTTVRIHEPLVTIVKTVNPTVVDAEDPLTYTLVITNPASTTYGATAYDVVVTDLIPTGLNYVGPINVIGGSVVPTTSNYDSGSRLITLTYDSLAQGQTSTISFNVVLDTLHYTGGSITNVANGTWTSQDCDDTDPLCVERTGEPPTDHTVCQTPTGINDYNACGTVTVTIADPTVEKTVTSTPAHSTHATPGYVMGELVTYRLVYTFPEGTTFNAVLSDTLPTLAGNGTAVDLDYVSYTIQPLPANTHLRLDGLPLAPANFTFSQAGDTLTWTPSGSQDIINNGVNDATLSRRQLIIDVTARVSNNAANVGTITNRDLDLVNTARIDFTLGDGGDPGFAEDTANIDLAEPRINITKLANPTSGIDSGDHVTYTLTVSHTGQSTANAYDIVITDSPPPIFSSPAFNAGASTCDAQPGWVTPVYSSGTYTFRFGQLDYGASCTIVYLLIAQDVIEATSSYINTARVTEFSTLPGDDPNERDVPPPAPVTEEITTRSPSLDKTVTSTPINPNGYTIGETVTYQIVYTFPEGTTRNVTLIDQLPRIGTEGAALRLVRAQIVSSEAYHPVPITTNGTFSDADGNGVFDTATWSFSPVRFLGDNNPNNNTIVVEIEAVVADVPENVGLTTGRDINLTNTARLRYTNSAGTQQELTDTADIDLVEPQLTIAKTGSPATADAGDTITYTLTIDHHATESTTDAHNVVISDTLPNITGTAVVNTLAVSGGTCQAQAGWNVDSSAMPIVTFSFDTLPLTADCTIIYTVTVADNAVIGTTYANSASITSYTTLPTDPTNPDIRTEPPTPPVTADFEIIVPTMVKTVTSTPVNTNGYTIGETVTYQIVYTFPEGTANNVTLVDELPRVATEGGLLTIVQAQITASGSTPALAVPLNGTINAANDTATWTLGNITFTGDNNTGNNTIVVEIEAVVADVPENVGLTTGRDINLTNTARLQYTDGNGTPQELTDTADIDLVEPLLTITKSNDATAPLEAGDTVTYTLTIDHHATESTAAAHSIVISDTLPNIAGTAVVSAPTLSGGTCQAQAGWNIDTSAMPTVTFSFNTLPLTADCTIEYTVTIEPNAVSGATYENSAEITSYTTLPPDPTNPEIRTEPPTPPVTADFEMDDPTMVKTLTSTSANTNGYTIGETVTYQIVYTFPQGTTNAVTLIDALPRVATEGGLLTIVRAQIISSGSTPALAVPLNGTTNAANDTATWTLGNLVFTGATPATIVVEIEAVVADVPENVGLTTGRDINLTNTARLQYTDGNGTPQELTDTADIDLVEPLLTITKTNDATAPLEAGDTVTYTLTIDHHATESTAAAHSIVISDTLPNIAGTAVVSAPTLSGGTCSALTGWNIDTSAMPTVTFSFNTLPLTADCTIEYTVTIEPNAVSGATYENSAEITSYTTLPPDPTNPEIRTEPPTPPVTADFEIADPSMVKTVTSSPQHSAPATPGYTIGETVTYEIVYTFPQGTTNAVTLIDELPRVATEGGLLTIVRAQIISSGSTPALAVPLNGTTNAANNTATWTLGNLVFTGATPATIVVEIEAVVADVPENVGLTTGRDINLTNTARLQYTDGNGTPQELTDTADVDLVEPQIQIAKSVAPAANTVEIGDTVTYTLTLSHTGESTADAHDIVISDTLPNIAGTAVVSAPTVSGGTCPALAGWSIDTSTMPTVVFGFDTLTHGTSCTIEYSVTVNSTAQYDTTYSNSAIITEYNSLPDPEDGREYNPPTPVTADFTPDTGAITKEVTGSSQAHTTPHDVLTIGEQVVYTVTVTLPEGTRDGVTVTDDLPFGTIDLEFVPASISFVSGGNLSHAAPTVIYSNVGGDATNDRVVWSFGTVTNSGADATPAASQIVFTITAVVRDTATNVGLITGQLQNQLNTATLNYNTPTSQGGTPVEYEDDAPISLVEPEIALTKSISTSTLTVEPGDNVTYTLNIAHTSESTSSAFNIQVRDILPTEGANLAVNFTSIDTAASTCDDINGAVTVDASGSPTILFSFAELPLGSSCDIVYTVTVTNDVLMDTDYQNLARVNSYTTTPDSPTTPNNRTEDPSPEDDEEFTTGTGGITKVITASDNPDTTPDDILTIGEVVTYTITATLPIGARNDVVVEDALPTNVVFEVVQAELTTVGSGITPAGILNSVATPVGNSLVWNLGNLNNASATPNTATSQLVFTVRLRVADDPANVGLSVPAQDISAINTAYLRYNTLDGIPVEYEDTEEIGLIEPEIELTKTADLDTALIGDTVSYQVVIQHTANSTFNAYDLVITDPLVTNLDLVVGSVSGVSTGGGTVSVITGNNAGDTTIRVDLDVFELGETLTITYQAVVSSGASVGSDLINVATVTGQSTPCNGASPCPGREVGDDDDHTVEVTPPTMTKSVIATSLAATGNDAYDPSLPDLTIGETVTYEIEAYIQEGGYVLSIVDPLPDVLEVVSSQIITIGANINSPILSVGDAGTHTDSNADGYDDTVTFSFGAITNVNDNIRNDNDLVVVQIVARVRDVAANEDGQTKTNIVTIHYGASTETAETTIDIVEPNVSLLKAFSVPIIAVNEPFEMTLVLTNTGNATAYDLLLLDQFDPYLRLLAAPVLDLSQAPGTTLTGGSAPLGFGSLIQYTFDQLLVGETITITAQVSIDINITPSPYTVVNTATITSDTIPTGHPDDAYGRTTTTPGVAEVIGAHPTLELLKVSDREEVSAGSFINYTITLTNTGDPAVNSNGIVITDTLAEYTSFVSVTTDMGTCAPASETTVVCNIDQLQPGETVTINLTVRTSPNTPDGYIAINTVDVTTDEGITLTTTARTRVYQPLLASAAVCLVGCPQVSVYHTNRDGNWEIYRIGDIAGQPDASENLTQNNSTDYAPSLSPDGSWFAFASDRDGNWEIYIAPTNGQTELTRRVTYNTVAIDTDPVWGSNNILVYESTRDGNWELYAFDLETGIETRLTDNDASDINPFWSSDGTRLLFQSDRSGQWQIYELTLHTASLRLVSDGTAQDIDASYNPSTTQIAFRSVNEDGNSVIHLMNANGTNRRAISDADGDASNAVWSPDGSLIAYQSDLDGDLDIYIYQLGSRITRQLTNNDVPDFAPTWLCGSTTVVWTSEEPGNPDIFSASALGINSPAISALEEAEHLVENDFDDVYAESAPVEENASREGGLPAPIIDNAVHPSFIRPSLQLTPIDRSLPRGTWDALNLCQTAGVAFPREEFNPSLYPVR